jgi:drug/metabolite transporter (DMT)-like permease
MMENRSATSRLTVLLIISMVFWGLSWPSNKILKSFGDPFVLGFLRYALVIVSMIPLLLIMKVNFRIGKLGILFVVISGLLMSVYNYTFLQGLEKGNPGAGGILVTTLNPIMAYSLGIVLAWRKPKKNEAIGIILGAIAGIVLLQLWKNLNILSDLGNALFLASALIWSIMSKFSSRSKEFGNPLAFTWWMYVVTIIAIAPFVDFNSVNNLVHSTEIQFWGNLLFGSVIVTSFATTMYFYATSQIGAERASSFIFTVPLCAGLSSFFILGEELHWYTILGGLLGIAAVYVLNRK